MLDALAIALGAFLAGCDVPATNLHKSDVRFLTYTHEGGIFHREARYPVSVSVGVKTDEGRDIDWERALNSANGRTTVREARPIMDYADTLCYRVQENMPVILPMLAYYGTGRLWLPKREKKGSVMRGVPSRLHGYIDALDAATNEKLMLQWFRRNALIVLQKGKTISTFDAVKQAMAEFYREMDETAELVQVDYDVESLEIEVYVKRKNEDPISLPLRYFSDGIKAMLSMTADIAYRMALLNPNLGGGGDEGDPGHCPHRRDRYAPASLVAEENPRRSQKRIPAHPVHRHHPCARRPCQCAARKYPRFCRRKDLPTQRTYLRAGCHIHPA